MERTRGVGAAALAVALTGAGALARTATSAPAAPATTHAVRVTARSGLNVRRAPSYQADILGVAPQNLVYAVAARQGTWTQLWFGDRKGWCHDDWLEAAQDAVLVVTATKLNVRAGPGTVNRVLGELSKGALVATGGRSGSWRKLAFEDHLGWASGAYLRSETPGVSGAGFAQLPQEGPGFYAYSKPERRWGTPELIEGLERVAKRWHAERPQGTSARIAVGEISLENGGPISGHVSHEKGVDVDIALPRDDGRETPRVDRFHSAYSRAGAQKLVDLFREELDVKLILFNDPKVEGAKPYDNHDNHLHVRIHEP